MIAITINTQAIRVEKWLLNFWNIGFSKSRHPLLASLTGVLSASVSALGSPGRTLSEPCYLASGSPPLVSDIQFGVFSSQRVRF